MTIPLFDKVNFKFSDNRGFTIIKKNKGKKINSITYGGKKVKGYFITDADLKKGKVLVIDTKK